MLVEVHIFSWSCPRILVLNSLVFPIWNQGALQLKGYVDIYILYIPRTEDHMFLFSFGKGSRAAFISHVSEAAWAAEEQPQSKPEETRSAGWASQHESRGSILSSRGSFFGPLTPFLRLGYSCFVFLLNKNFATLIYWPQITAAPLFNPSDFNSY